MNMNKKEYQKPTMKVVELQHRTMLLSGSPLGSVQTSGFDDHEDNLDITDTPGSIWGR